VKPFEALRAPFEAFREPFEVLREPFEVLRSPFEVLREPFEVLRSPFEVLREPFEVLREPFEVLREPFEVLRAPFGAMRTPSMGTGDRGGQRGSSPDLDLTRRYGEHGDRTEKLDLRAISVLTVPAPKIRRPAGADVASNARHD
jgi:hypothetical protein